jgi:hypothetical protein
MIRKSEYGFSSRQSGTRLRADYAQIKEIERDDNLKKSHHAPAYRYRSVLAYRNGVAGIMPRRDLAPRNHDGG